MMGAGKTETSRKLSRVLKKEFVSTDQIIEERQWKKIVDIFREQGEAYFRRLEREVVKELADRKNLIIDCGGGIVLNEENMRDLRKNGILIYLMVSAQVSYDRVKHNPDRPLLQEGNPREKIKELLSQREPLYSRADYKINTDHKTVETVSEEVIKLLSHD